MKEEQVNFLQQELSKIFEMSQSHLKTRRKREFFLVVACLVALVYFMPAASFETDPQIEIPAISLKISLKYFSSLFPTILAAIYLIYVSSLITDIGLLFNQRILKGKIESRLKLGLPSYEEGINKSDITLAIYSYFLPSPLSYRIVPETALGRISRWTVQFFVGSVFNFLPYITVVAILIRVYKETNHMLLLIWNILCVIIMLFSFIGTFISFFKKTRQYPEKTEQKNK